ncbi:MAG: hypothetical protein BWY81_00509 [Firmicutes bacterium ADurb.Bin467]|nr:MAG: hypothetical protein BWY81_00509 [Firmicutes bacterium ADurb.Bin467]
MITFNPVSYEDEGVVFVAGEVEVSWHADGDVDRYRIAIRNADTNEVYVDTTTAATSNAIPEGNLAEGVLYRIDVTAIPINGTEADGNSDPDRAARRRSLRAGNPLQPGQL